MRGASVDYLTALAVNFIHRNDDSGAARVCREIKAKVLRIRRRLARWKVWKNGKIPPCPACGSRAEAVFGQEDGRPYRQLRCTKISCGAKGRKERDYARAA